MKIFESTRERINNYLNNRSSGVKKLAELEKLAEDHKILASYIICANLRSGSSLLASGLRKSGIAGSPDREYFLFKEFNNRNPGKDFLKYFSTLKDYLSDLYQETKTDNGVFGFKIMWPALDTLLNKIDHMGFDTRNRRAILERIFPHLKLIYIYRQDKLRQAISLVRANQSKVYHIEKGSGRRENQHDLKYDGFQITSDLLQHVIINEINWNRFFKVHEILPLIICYERFSADYSGYMKKTLDYLNLPGNENAIISYPHFEKTRDDLTEQWVERYLNENPWLADDNVRDQLYKNNNFELAMERFQKYNKDPELKKNSKRIWKLIEEQRS